jgi:hypothetical protein
VTELLQENEPSEIGPGEPPVEPPVDEGRWKPWMSLAVGVVVMVVLLVVAILLMSSSAGAAGGCGGG